MIIANDKGIIKDRTALNAFFANLAANGTYEVHQPIVEDAFRHLPIHMRDADVFLLPGAYKAGSIAMMNKIGEIVGLGFSRNTVRHRAFDDIIETPINIPRLDNMCYSNSIGYCIDEETTFMAGSRPYGGFRLTSTMGNSTFASPSVFMEQGGAFYRNTSWDTGTWPISDVINSTIVFKPINPENRFIYFESAATQVFSMTIDLENNKVSAVGSNVIYHSLRTLNNGYWILTFRFIPVPNPLLPYTSLRYYPNTRPGLGYNWNDGDTTKGFELVNMSISDKPVESFHIANVVSGTYTKGADLTGNIILTQSAIIYIKTAKTTQEFTLPAGNFNINDYVVNDKLITMAIKY